MDTNTTRRNLLRIGTTAAAYAAGASIVTGGIAIASQAKGATLSPGLANLIDNHRKANAISEHIAATAINPGYDKRRENPDAGPSFAVLHSMETEALAPVHAARQAVIDFPCATFTDLRTKLDWIDSNDGLDGDELLPLVMSDLDRIAAQEAR